MSSRLPALTGKEVVYFIEKHGFFFVSQKGRTTIIPIHGTEEIGPGLLLQILNDAGIDPKELRH